MASENILCPWCSMPMDTGEDVLGDGECECLNDDCEVYGHTFATRVLKSLIPRSFADHYTQQAVKAERERYVGLEKAARLLCEAAFVTDHSFICPPAFEGAVRAAREALRQLDPDTGTVGRCPRDTDGDGGRLDT